MRRSKSVWFPYAQHRTMPDPLQVVSAHGSRLQLEDGRELIDGIASWWSAIHGYNHPVLNQSIEQQLGFFAHVMMGGFTHHAVERLA
ncbi:aminotransferase class III-fold pyridoxal phosphate-dependent enzyme, partial [bacterium]|nr:aminotransferase class III-fold pyridoxal phosphate-dependent enzyme [bacterium]